MLLSKVAERSIHAKVRENLFKAAISIPEVCFRPPLEGGGKIKRPGKSRAFSYCIKGWSITWFGHVTRRLSLYAQLLG